MTDKKLREIAKQLGKNTRKTLIKLSGNKNPKISRIKVALSSYPTWCMGRGE